MKISPPSFPSYEKLRRSQSSSAPNQVPTEMLTSAEKIMAEMDASQQVAQSMQATAADLTTTRAQCWIVLLGLTGKKISRSLEPAITRLFSIKYQRWSR